MWRARKVINHVQHNSGRNGFLPARDMCMAQGEPIRAQMWISALHEHGFAMKAGQVV
jgi:hypothetical protein